RSQTQILAGSSESTVTATATATWAKQGAIPALSAAENCAENGLDVTTVNEGDTAFTFELLDSEYTIAPGETRTVTVSLREDQSYDFTVTAPGGQEHRFTGVLDCQNRSSMVGDSPQTVTEPSPATTDVITPDVNLADTGGSEVTPLIGGMALALMAVGGVTLLVIRRKNTEA
ncbi:DUF756 domain-containing protein, partial [Streptomyces sp. TRM76130]|nr:DUF756 domain-containing protein [Streptomyces sp. TRM76130]